MSAPLVNIGSNAIAGLSKGELLADNISYQQGLLKIIDDIYNKVHHNQEFFRYLIRQVLFKHVPVRSGLLLDTLLTTLQVDIIGHNVIISATPPAGYPLRIEHPAHLGGIGWAYKYIPVNPIPNRTVISETQQGAYYGLNDPDAIADYISLFQSFVAPTIIKFIESMHFSYSVEVGATTLEDPPKIRRQKITIQDNLEELFDSYSDTLPPPTIIDVKPSVNEPKVRVWSEGLRVAWEQEEFFDGTTIDFTKWDSN